MSYRDIAAKLEHKKPTVEDIVHKAKVMGISSRIMIKLLTTLLDRLVPRIKTILMMF
ncbi:hypothetical protein L873DRAFT_1804762 [Choiromyces venosus 120613-1]|uniref:Uncharacterized protein n=1 Tax=Choiromyces venosus 120613-1 TaxID=1336337 RepID=A0A3N4JQT6_9PEZI|nr:hypothetical protein L873DRAFT_1804762 [Choiromyces venosus 120613-1]